MRSTNMKTISICTAVRLSASWLLQTQINRQLN